jgi:hypothetical protein
VTRLSLVRPSIARPALARPALALALLGVAVGCSSDDTADSPPSSSSAPSTSAVPSSTAVALDDSLRLNEIQVVGTHNSFHQEPDPAELDLLAAMDAEQAAQRTYSHETIGGQLADQQVRQIELDVFVDGSGGLYASPSLRRQAGLPDLVDSVPEMAEPGTKVLHEQDVDYHSVCPTLVGCLTEVAEWSDANPDHVPVAIFIQFKDGPLIFPVADQAVPEKWVPENMDRLEDEIRSVFEPDDLLTPDDVRGSSATLEEAVTTDGWPTLGETRGKVLFAMVNGEPYRSLYLEGHEAWPAGCCSPTRSRASPTPPCSTSTTPSPSRAASPTWSARGTWCAPGPTRRTCTPAPTTPPAATPPSPRVRTGSEPTTRCRGWPRATSDPPPTTWPNCPTPGRPAATRSPPRPPAETRPWNPEPSRSVGRPAPARARGADRGRWCPAGSGLAGAEGPGTTIG